MCKHRRGARRYFKGPRLSLPRLPCLGTHGTHRSQLEWDLGKAQRKGREHLSPSSDGATAEGGEAKEMGMPGAYLCGGSEGIPPCAGGNASRRRRIPAAPDKRGQPGGPQRGARDEGCGEQRAELPSAGKGTGQQW